MLKHIIAQNFKCFKSRVKIPLGQINLLTGINGRGKSTALQTLLLMNQSLEHSRSTNKLVFNGSCVELGNFDDVRNATTTKSEPINISFRFQNNNNCIDVNYFFSENETDEMSAQISRLTLSQDKGDIRSQLDIEYNDDEVFLFNGDPADSTFWENLLVTSNALEFALLDEAKSLVNFTNVHYISADRIGPKDFYLKQSFKDFPNVGTKGEFTPNILYRKRNEVVNPDICLDSGETHTLPDQVQAWLSVIFDGAKLELIPTEANIVLMSLNSENTSHGFKPVNVGFGYSYALPIIVAGLIAQPGEILIVENPEAHLHPYAQSQITKFLAQVSSTGVQVFIESHSDHILNGLRISALDKVVNSEDLHILYFGKENLEEIVRIPVDKNGGIESWPEGFFDQLDNDFSRLFGA